MPDTLISDQLGEPPKLENFLQERIDLRRERPPGAPASAVSAFDALAENAPIIGQAQIAEALTLYEKYKSGKTALDKRIIDNELWFKMNHWKNYENPLMEGKPAPSSGWLFNSIANKHADAMDNVPEANVLPRAGDDMEVAQQLSSILPAVLESNDYDQVYSKKWWRKLKQGTGVTAVFWDSSLRGGLGDIVIRSIDMLNIYWEPGIEDIQESENIFTTALMSNKKLVAQWPQMTGHTGNAINLANYIHDQSIDTSDKSVVFDWYYKVDQNGRSVLHYCKFCNGVVLYASQNDPAYAERGFYDHGKYPFVFDPLFEEEDSPAGFGYIDVMKDCQTAIDTMNQIMQENVTLASKPRYFLSDTAGVNEEELTDFSQDVVHFTGKLSSENFFQQPTIGLQAYSLSFLNNRIAELKETSGNRDFSQGATTSGVTAASAIAALQEAGSKLSRDMLKGAYRAFTQECYLCIELMRQFYDEKRVFRIIGENNAVEFVEFSNSALLPQDMGTNAQGFALGNREPIFDIKVAAAKKSTFSRLSQNELAKELYAMALFRPDNADQALAVLEMMDFEGIEKVRDRIRENRTLSNQVADLQNQIVKMGAILDQLQLTEGLTRGATEAFAEDNQARANARPRKAPASAGSTSNSLGATVANTGTQADAAIRRAMNVTNPNK